MQLMFTGLMHAMRSLPGAWFQVFGSDVFAFGSAITFANFLVTPWTIGDLWLSHRKYSGGLKRLFKQLRENRKAWSPRRIAMQLGIGGLLGGVVGYVSKHISGPNGASALLEVSSLMATGVLVCGIYYWLSFTIVGAVVNIRDRILAAETARQQAELQRSELNCKLHEARVQALQAQIEPHFLFNTLGAVQQLAECDPPLAVKLTAELITFLRATLGQIRLDHATVASEIKIIRSYLAIMQQRLGGRLSTAIHIDDAVANASIPPSMLLTLVENAIKHGIEPCRRGGSIQVEAHQMGTRLVLSVADTGAGMSETPGDGLGLNNIRERLALMYCDDASLELEENEPSGLLAKLNLPLETKSAEIEGGA
jgi:hypothetical protein